MKIVIAGGNHEADYIISSYKRKQNNLIVINPVPAVAKYLSEHNGIPVVVGDITRESDLARAEIQGADLFIALDENDVNSYISCKMAMKLFSVKRCIATVLNPKNVQLFKQLGIETVVCSTYLLAEQIKNEASINNLINTLTLEDNQIIILEISVNAGDAVCGQSLSAISISDKAVVSAVYRNHKAIIPNGSTVLEKGDHVLVVTTIDHKDEIGAIFQGQH
jgi:trk system potassium uptake protein TrkA